MYCKYCGNNIDENSKFCPNCGANIEAEQVGNTSSESTAYSAPDYSQSQYANYTPTYTQNPNEGQGLAIAGFVCSLVSIFCFGIILGIIGIVLSNMAKSKGYTGGLATAGIVMGIIGLVGAIIVLFAGIFV